MFEGPIQAITLDDNMVAWLKEALRESSRDAFKSQENRLNLLNKQYERTNSRLSKLYDFKIDGDIGEIDFKSKENEYKTELIAIKAQIDNAKAINPNFYEDGCKTLELAKTIGTNQELALELWQTGIYDARILGALIADPKQMKKAR